jgi:Carboxypeptidase regulatory-like domain/TonB dependent receptor/TonB-dependent Receptor Plug Domain
MNKKRLLSACRPMLGVLALIIAMAGPWELAHAASGDGSLVGRLNSADKGTVSGAEVTARNPATGFSRTVKADADGFYRFPFLPVGTYMVEAAKDGKSLGSLADITVSLGAATTADLELSGDRLEVVQVVGSRIVNAVDVKSTEIATNISREELERLPVERDALSVALLAPGISRGHEFSGTPGLSFGGSSVAENTIYINGLNVTDFYNRIGFSAVPYAFYKEFQVKTGGYSVEFGRTTGGVINAVTRSGTNKFEFGSEITWEPDFLQSAKSDRPGILGRYDEYNRKNYDVWAAGPIIRDKLFFFALYEFRDYTPVNTDDSGIRFDEADEDDGFWGAKIDWQINDKNLIELLAFSDKNQTITDSFGFDSDTGTRGAFENRRFENEGGRNWAATYTAYLTSNLSAKALYGENDRQFSRLSQNDIDCNRVRDLRGATAIDVGCTNSANIITRDDTREAARLDFEWAFGAHQLRFGMDYETNTSDHNQFYPGADRLLYEVRIVDDEDTLENGAPRPANVTEFVRTRQNEVAGSFETVNRAYYLEDNWSITPNLVLNAGVRLEAFDNRNAEGQSYIKMDDMVAPRFGFSWDMKGDGRTKLFGNAGRYFLPVANVINIKQAGGFLDARNWYVFEGFETFEYNGLTRRRPILGAQLGGTDTSQGDGSVGDLRGEVDADMDPVYQDELILGFQSMIDDKWSWGVRGTYRKLTNAIDDMEISSTGILCDGAPVSNGFIMANPGKVATIFSDTDCDGENDAFVDVDTSRGGWAIFDRGGNYLGDAGYLKPRRNYKSMEFVVDRAWDGKWSANAAYTLAFAKGNAEGPVNTDTDFGDTGRTEAFDDPWVNFGGYGYLPNDHRHQIKFRGTYGFGSDWRIGLTLNTQSGRPISAFGTGNPFDTTNYHSFFICTANCGPGQTPVYELFGRGSMGRTPWTYDLSANVTWQHQFGLADMQVRFAVYNLLNQERVLEVDESFRPTSANNTFGQGTTFFAPRYGQLTLQVRF